MDSKVRHILKAVTWRIIASVTTFLLALFIFGDDPDAAKKATWVALSEAVLKIGFYYLHERAWYKVDLGLAERKSSQNE